MGTTDAEVLSTALEQLDGLDSIYGPFRYNANRQNTAPLLLLQYVGDATMPSLVGPDGGGLITPPLCATPDYKTHSCPTEENTSLQKVLGVCIGVVLVLCVGYSGYMFKRNPKKFRTVVLQLLSVEIIIISSTAWELWDYFADAWMLAQHVLPDNQQISDLVTPWLICFAIASLASCVSFYVKLKTLIRAFRLRREEADLDASEVPTGSLDKVLALHSLHNHRMSREKASRAINGVYAGLALALGEDLPLGMFIACLVVLLNVTKVDSVWAVFC